jgi:hypothetical protein
MIDLDSVEYCWLCFQPLVLIELKRAEAGTRIGTVTSILARMANVDAYLVVYQQDGDDIEWFEVNRWYPQSNRVDRMQPQEYAEWLWKWRELHLPKCTRPAARHWIEHYRMMP